MPLVRAVLDACVLIPFPVCDTLLRAAAGDLYQARWSEEILDEVRRNLVKAGRSEAQAQRRLAAMKAAFGGALVTGYEHLIGQMQNDPKDRHVLAAAVAAEAQVIVTSNLSDFPESVLKPLGIVAQSPDAFLTRLFALDAEAPDVLADVVRQQAGDLRAPPMTVWELLDRLDQHAPTFARLIRDHMRRS